MGKTVRNRPQQRREPRRRLKAQVRDANNLFLERSRPWDKPCPGFREVVTALETKTIDGRKPFRDHRNVEFREVQKYRA